MSQPDRVKECIDRLKIAQAAVEKQRKREKDDLAFQLPEGAWPSDVAANRGSLRVATSSGPIDVPARPMLSIASLDEPIQLVLNQRARAHLGINIAPLDIDATDDTAKVLEGLYRSIERESNADLARGWAYERGVKCGWGCYAVDVEADPSSTVPGDLRIKIRRVLFQENVFFDPFAVEPDWSDAEWAIEIMDLPVPRYKRLYPNSELAGLNESELLAIQTEQEGWVGGEGEDSRTIRIANYFWCEWDETEVTGTDWRGNPVKVTDRTPKVYRCRVNAKEELEAPDEWYGPDLPFVPAVGRELIPVDGKRIMVGMIHPAKDGVRLTNYAASSAAEMAALEPKAPWQGVEGVFEGHETEYQQSNVRNIPFLQHRPRDLAGNPAPAPTRVQVDVSRLGPSMQLLSMGRDFVQSATATFDPALGKQPTAHRSGRAIQALQDQTVEGTSHYLDNLLKRSMPREGRIVLGMIPNVYDRPGRVVQILNHEGATNQAMLNQPHVATTQGPQAIPPGPDGMPMPMGHPAMPPHALNFDLSKGRYGVNITVGKSYASQVEQGNDQLGNLLQADPNLFPILGWYWLKLQDWPGAKEASEDLKKLRPPQLQEQNDPNSAAMQVPQLQAQVKQLTAHLQQASQIIETKAVEQKAKVQVEQISSAAAVEMQRMKDATSIAVAKINAMAKGIIVAQEAQDEAIALAQEQQHEAQQAAMDRAHEAGMGAMGHSQATQQADQAHQIAITQADQQHQQAMTAADQGQQHALEQGQQAADLAPPPATGGGNA